MFCSPRPCHPTVAVIAAVAASLALFAMANPSPAASPSDALLRAYKSVPTDYPSTAEFARPDTSSGFRWHQIADDIVPHCADAKMRAHVEPYNVLEDGGVTTDLKDTVVRDGVKCSFVREHVTTGDFALRVVYSAEAIGAAKAVFRIQCNAGGPTFSDYYRRAGTMPTASCYAPHFRWFKLDCFNPASHPVNVKVGAAPMIVPTGKSVIAVKLVDLVRQGYDARMPQVSVTVTSPEKSCVLYFDHARMEQEVPATIERYGRLLQFPGRSAPEDAPVAFPGFTTVESDTLYSPPLSVGWLTAARERKYAGHSFRSFDNGLLWGYCYLQDSPLRIDLPNGRYHVVTLGAPYKGYVWKDGLHVRVNGERATLLAPLDDQQLRRLALSGETWDYRPGTSVWAELVRPVFYPPMEMDCEVTNRQLALEFTQPIYLHALLILPESHAAAARRELGRFQFILSESWDITHPWIKGDYAAATADGRPYIGAHPEQIDPLSIASRLEALDLSAADWKRGFVPFARGLTEAIYPDTIPDRTETAVTELRCVSVRGERECVTLGLLPLEHRRDLKVVASDLVLTSAAEDSDAPRLAASAIDIRVSRYHQKTMQISSYNHDYNYQEHYLIRRPTFDLQPGVARRLYFDIAVPADAIAGEYRGEISVRGAGDQPLFNVPLVVEVSVVGLDAPRAFFAANHPDPRYRDYGFNAFATTYEKARLNNFRGLLTTLGTGALKIEGKSITWSSLLENADAVRPLIAAGRTGAGPRLFVGGKLPKSFTTVVGAQGAEKYLNDLREELPELDLLGRSAFVFHLGNHVSFSEPHEWECLAGSPQPAIPAVMEAARRMSNDFWFVDGIRGSKEHAARFTFGVWFWRLGGAVRFTTLEAPVTNGGGTSRLALPHEPYYSLMDGGMCNVDRAIMESQSPDHFNPCRDLILLREGIEDYRLLQTLDARLASIEAGAAATTVRHPRVQAARRFRDQLRDELSLDLRRYYVNRAAAYGENWYVRPDHPWTDARFDTFRREVIFHLKNLAAL